MPPKIMKNTKGAADYLGCTENWIHKLVYSGRLKAYIYDENGELVERAAKEKRQGQGLYFHESDLRRYDKYKGTVGRPMGAKDKKTRKQTKQQEAA